MIFTSHHTQPYRLALDHGLTLKSVVDANDAERVIAFNEQIFDANVAAMTRSLMFHHPASRSDYWLYIEDQSEIVSSLALLPCEWRYDEVMLKCGEMGIVGTRESVRNRGLVKALDSRFKEILRAEHFHLSPLQGIPYFYRQFGYDYALPLESQWRIELRQLSDAPDPKVNFRLATTDDIPILTRFYNTTAQSLNISAIRTTDIWRYLLEHTTDTATEAEIWVLEIDQQPLAYCRIPRDGFGEGLIVSEASRLDLMMANAMLHWLKMLAIDRDKPYIRFNLPPTNDLLVIARAHGAYDAGGYQWQIHVVDVPSLLRQVTPVLERRMAASPFANLSQQVVINLYRNGVELHIVHGRVTSVTPVARPDDSDINIPPHLIASLVLGYRSREALAAFYPDFRIHGQAEGLIDVLFPGMSAFIDANY